MCRREEHSVQRSVHLAALEIAASRYAPFALTIKVHSVVPYQEKKF